MFLAAVMRQNSDKTTKMKKREIRLAVILLSLFCLLVGDMRSEVVPIKDRTYLESLHTVLRDAQSSRVLVVAHRGCWANGDPENSLAAISRCLDLGVDIVEIDVSLTLDRVPVLLHDATVDRTANGTGRIQEMAFAEVQRLRLKSGKGGQGSAPTTQRIPTLNEALQLAKDRILINLDVKGLAFDEAFRVISRLGCEDQIIMKMRASPTEERLKKAAFHGQTYFMPILSECSPDSLVGCTAAICESVPAYATYNPVAYEVVFQSIEYFTRGVVCIQNSGCRIWVNSLEPRHAAGLVDPEEFANPDSSWGKLIDMGANIIQTDRPAELISYLQRKGRR